MKFTIRNLGKLREATIDLRKNLVLLTGPNNTSKTYVAHAIYGLHLLRGSLIELVTAILREDFKAGDSAAGFRLEVDVVDFVERHSKQLLTALAERYKKQLSNVFASSEEFVSQAEIELELDSDRLPQGRQRFLDFEDSGSDIGGLSPAGIVQRKIAGSPISTFEKLGDPLQKNDWNTFLSMCGSIISAFIYAFFFDLPIAPYVLTAERAAIQLFSRELSRNRTKLVDALLEVKNQSKQSGARAMLDILGQRAQRYPLAIRDELEYANDRATNKKMTSLFAPLAERLERELLGGAFRIDDDGEVLFHPESSGAGLTLHLASSSVKSLAGLSFFLRHIAQPRQLLIIDEPELNLHPDNQRRVARVLARLAKAGVKVLVTTHSDYFIRELNNLIMLSADLDGTVRQRNGYDAKEVLAPDQVEAYLFDATHAIPIQVTSSGVEVKTIDQVLNSLNSTSQDIYFSLIDKPGA